MTAALLIGLLACAPPAEAPYDPSWTLVWSDEFDGPAGSPPSDVWVPDIGAGGWGNEQLEYNTDDPDNASLDGEGHLAITARREARDGAEYTSARLTTAGRYTHGPGRFEAVMQLPAGTGLWPAFWMLGEDYPTVGWPNCGEIDILEAKGQEPKRIQGALHFGGRWPANTFTVGEHFFDSGSIADFHVYALEWNPGEMHWEVDGKVYATMNSWWSTGRVDEKGGVAPQAEADLNPWPAPFDKPFQVLINLAVGGKFLGNPDATTPFPAEMEVDYVRVYERTGPQPALLPRGKGKLPFAAPAR